MPTLNKSILVANHDEFTERILTEQVTAQGLRVIGVENAIDALRHVQDQSPDVLCVAADLCGGDGWTIARMLRCDERFAMLPIVMIVASENAGNRLQAQQLGVTISVGSACLWEKVKPLLVSNETKNDERHSARTGAPKNSVRPIRLEESVDRRTPNPSSSCGSFASEPLLDFVFSIMEQDVTPITLTDSEPRPWVLCVDDDRDYSAVLTHRLHKQGIDVINAFDGAEGITKACRLPADLILLDYDMPSGTGDHVLKELKLNATTKDIPVVVITGNKNNDIRRLMLGLGADEFLQKPVPFHQLFEVMSNYIVAKDTVQ